MVTDIAALLFSIGRYSNQLLGFWVRARGGSNKYERLHCEAFNHRFQQDPSLMITPGAGQDGLPLKRHVPFRSGTRRIKCSGCPGMFRCCAAQIAIRRWSMAMRGSRRELRDSVALRTGSADLPPMAAGCETPRQERMILSAELMRTTSTPRLRSAFSMADVCRSHLRAKRPHQLTECGGQLRLQLLRRDLE